MVEASTKHGHPIRTLRAVPGKHMDFECAAIVARLAPSSNEGK